MSDLLSLDDEDLPLMVEEIPPEAPASLQDLARATPSPRTAPLHPMPAYGLEGAGLGLNAPGTGITARDVKAAGVGALFVLLIGGIVRLFSRS